MMSGPIGHIFVQNQDWNINSSIRRLPVQTAVIFPRLFHVSRIMIFSLCVFGSNCTQADDYTFLPSTFNNACFRNRCSGTLYDSWGLCTPKGGGKPYSRTAAVCVRYGDPTSAMDALSKTNTVDDCASFVPD